MRKRIITAAAFSARLALCAAVWPQNEPVGENPALPTPPAVVATKPEEENAETMEPEQTEVVIPIPEPKQESEVAPASPKTSPDNMVYVEGFGWLESQGPNHVEYAEDMYENGNKIGSMG